MANLKTDYKDDILDSTQNLRRKFRMITNDDGTFSFEDVTDYLQYGDSFGATDLNAITEKVNKSLTSDDVVDNTESTATNLPLSANKGRELNDNFKDIIIIEMSTKIVSFTANARVNITFTPPEKEGYKSVGLMSVVNTTSNVFNVHFVDSKLNMAQCSNGTSGELTVWGRFLMVKDL